MTLRVPGVIVRDGQMVAAKRGPHIVREADGTVWFWIVRRHAASALQVWPLLPRYVA